MTYEVLARKYRPMSFADLVGQEHVARTLGNAIEVGRVAHAFLFTGVRGVGKTTSARILAKALNCLGRPGTHKPGVDPGPTLEPCLACDACEQIRMGTDVDVREIDGASYNGVDEVRRLQDSLPYQPQRDRFKIFIVDEVHMLSQAAWNAFLKSLEEPPPHVKFIFATTEVHKVPVTILSRCQRFDFRLIPTQTIATRLRDVLSKENIATDEAAIQVIAREAAGSMRDAMSLLDQVIAWGGEDLAGKDVARVLGVASHQVLHDLAAALVDGDASKCLRIVAALANDGYDVIHVAKDALALIRDLVVAKVCASPGDLLDLADDERRDVCALGARASPDDLVRLHQGFSNGFDEVARAGQPRAALEMLLVRLARRPALVPIDDLVARLGALERRLAAPSAGTPDLVARGGGRSRETTRARGREPASAPRRGAPAPSDEEPPPGAASIAHPSPDDAKTAEPAESRAHSQADRGGARGASSEKPRSPPPPGTKAAAWRAILALIRANRPELAAVLQHAAPLSVTVDSVRLGYERGSLWQKQASSPELQGLVQKAAHAYFGAEANVSFDFDSRDASVVETVAAADLREKEEQRAAQRALAESHPIVEAAVRVLGARVRGVTLPED